MSFVHARHPVAWGRWADPRIADNLGVTHGVQVRPILFDPSAYLTSSADGPVAGDDDVDFVRHALEQQRRMARGMRLVLDDPDLRATQGSRSVSAGRPVMRPSRSSGTCSTMSGGINSAMRAFARASDSRSGSLPLPRW